mmetsp:Transcript_9103/g.9856  ORF Transcript_9103/g.9856 Transcript_9103/m.9856 type:complete len:80 (+) Transcript_9103:158-397(+)
MEISNHPLPNPNRKTAIMKIEMCEFTPITGKSKGEITPPAIKENLDPYFSRIIVTVGSARIAPNTAATRIPPSVVLLKS